MTGDDIGNLVYLGLLGVAVFGYFIAAGRESMGQTLRYLTLWGLIFVGVVAAAGLWPMLRDQIAPQQVVTAVGTLEVPLGPDGHYHMTLGINGAPIRFVVDTGASDMVLTQDDARRAGIEPDRLAYLGRAQTANGTVAMARVRLDTVTLGDTVERDVPASVNGGQMFSSLLGMSYLSRFGRISIENNRLTLER